MARSARVTSIDAVQRFAGVLRRFQEDASGALENLAMELQRALDWIQNNQKDYWALQVRRSYERVGEAKANLQQRQTYHRVGDHEPSCIDRSNVIVIARRPGSTSVAPLAGTIETTLGARSIASSYRVAYSSKNATTRGMNASNVGYRPRSPSYSTSRPDSAPTHSKPRPCSYSIARRPPAGPSASK